MCGLVGICIEPGQGKLEPAIVEAMTETLTHRGPDDFGVWMDTESPVGLGHRRLSIQDLSHHGHQPMVSKSGEFIVVFNGEIYNYLQIKKDLESLGEVFNGHSDTEVMLRAIEIWGLDRTLTHIRGMFAFALWNTKKRELTLCRDRLGEKPLYYGWSGAAFLFASELKAMRAYPKWEGKINYDTVGLLLRYNYIPSPYSVYKNIYKLPAGTTITFTLDQMHHPEGFSYTVSGEAKLRPQPYWSIADLYSLNSGQCTFNETEVVDKLEELLISSVNDQMVADVPLGAFLSGGTDSSLIVSIMQSLSSVPVKTFTIGFDEQGYNEAVYAKEAADYLGTEHTELYVSPQQALEVIPQLPSIYDEPFSDCSQIPTILVSRLARKHVTVSLSGDGGDELFYGYTRYAWGERLWSRLGGFPLGLRKFMSKSLTTLSPETWNTMVRPLNSLLSERHRLALPGDKIHKAAGVLVSDDNYTFYKNVMSHWKNPQEIVKGIVEPSTVFSEMEKRFGGDLANSMMLVDILSYLPDDILVKVDRAAMSSSLETRVPLLDYRIVEFASKVPVSIKNKDGIGKWPMKQLLNKYIPKSMTERPKMGFAVPIDSWLRGPLREWGENLLDENRLKQEGVFNEVKIRACWNEHIKGERNWHYHLWDVLMFQAWVDNLENSKS